MDIVLQILTLLGAGLLVLGQAVGVIMGDYMINVSQAIIKENEAIS